MEQILTLETINEDIHYSYTILERRLTRKIHCRSLQLSWGYFFI
jgi:hypothetical protein